MKAADVMTHRVITTMPHDPVVSVVEKMLENRVSALPVVDEEDHVMGIVSEGDLMNRPENKTFRGRSWWLNLISTRSEQTSRFLKIHGTKASDIMTSPAITATEEDDLSEIARQLERHHIKRVPIVRNGILVGIVSRANLLRMFASGISNEPETKGSNGIRLDVLRNLEEAGLMTHLLTVTVTEESVELWGLVESNVQIAAARVGAERAARPRTVITHLSVMDLGLPE